MIDLNLCEILKGHEGETFYSKAFEEIVLTDILGNGLEFYVSNSYNETFIYYDIYGKLSENGELDLFPSKEQLDWNKWVEEQKSKVSKTWSDYINSNLYNPNSIINEINKYHLIDNSIEKSALALLKIHQLIEVRYGGNVDKTKEFYSIAYDVQDKRFIVRSCYNVIYDNVAVCFNSKELAEEFLLYKENIELLKDYFMLW